MFALSVAITVETTLSFQTILEQETKLRSGKLKGYAPFTFTIYYSLKRHLWFHFDRTNKCCRANALTTRLSDDNIMETIGIKARYPSGLCEYLHGRGHWVVVLCKTLYSHNASLRTNKMPEGLRWTSILSGGSRTILQRPSRFMLQNRYCSFDV